MEKKKEKVLDVKNVEDLKEKVTDVEVIGNGNTFQLIDKAGSKSQGWMKSTKAMQIDEVGCVIQVTTQQGDNVSEALTFVPGVRIGENEEGDKVIEKIKF